MGPMIQSEEFYKEGIRFPLGIKEYGTNYIGVNKSINKPHGMKEIMSSIIKLSSKRPIKFDTLIKKLVDKFSRNDIDDAIEVLKKDGIIQTFSKNSNPRKGRYFSISKICIDPRAEADIKTNINGDMEEKLSQLKEAVIHITKESSSLLAKHLRNCVEEGALRDLNGCVIVNIKAWIAFRSVALALAYSVMLKEKKEYATLREISVEVWGKSKILDRYKTEITKVAGMSLSKLNFNIFPETTYFYGDILGEINNTTFSGLAGYPVIITDLTIKSLNITEVKAKSILIIENLAVFLSVFSKKYINNYDTLIIWGEGYLSSSKRVFLKKIIKNRKLPVYVWSDLDGDGLELTLDIISFVESKGTAGRPVLMGEDELKLSFGEFKGANHINLEKEELKNLFPDVINSIKEGRTMEQEELLLHFDYINIKLP